LLGEFIVSNFVVKNLFINSSKDFVIFVFYCTYKVNCGNTDNVNHK